jgi:hypothetical protein
LFSALLCRIFSVLACGISSSTAASAASLDLGSSGGSNGCCCLPAAVVRELFIQLLLLSPQLASAELKGLLLQLLMHLVNTGESLLTELCQQLVATCQVEGATLKVLSRLQLLH